MKKYYVGVDVSKKTLDISIYDKVSNLPENYLRVSNNVSGFRDFSRWLKSKKIKFGEVVLCMEYTGVYNLEFCVYLESSRVDYSLVSGLVIKRSLGIQRGKNDKLDSYRIARYCYIFRDELSENYYKVPSANLLRLRELMTERRNCIKRQVQCKTYLTEHKEDVLSTSVSRFTQELKLVESFVKEIEKEILNLIVSDSDMKRNYDLLVSVVGVSLVNAVNVILYTQNFSIPIDARSYACYCGVAPFEHQSGSSIRKSPRVSRMSNRQLKVDLSQAAMSAVRFDTELQMYFNRKIASGKQPGCVYNAVKFKVICRMFSTVKRGTPYVKLGGFATLK